MKNFVNGDRFEAGDKIKIETAAKLHSGGPYIDAESRVAIKLKRKLLFKPSYLKNLRFSPIKVWKVKTNF